MAAKSTNTKIIVVGAPRGAFAELFPKLAAIHAKQQFTLCLIAGDLFGAPPPPSPSDDATAGAHDCDGEAVRKLVNGEIQVPLPTYFGLGSHALPPAVVDKLGKSGGGEVCENLFFLGRKAILTTSEGIRIVALGGVLGTAEGEGAEFLPFYSETEAKGLKGANDAHILLTNEWPEGVVRGAKQPASGPGATTSSSTAVAELAKALCPRYHFSPGGGTGFYERAPYKNPSKSEMEGVKITRFLALGDWGNSQKAKAMYAFTMDLEKPPQVTAETTESPFAATKRKRTADGDGDGSFFFGEHTGSGYRGKRRFQKKKQPPSQQDCFLCLSFKNLEKHLLTSIGTEAYLTIAKGALTDATTNPKSLPFSSHIQIITMAHAPSVAAIEPKETRETTLEEMHRYRAALESMLEARNCMAVTFEISRAHGVHALWQMIPIGKDRFDSSAEDVVDAAFSAVAKDAQRPLPDFEEESEENTEGDFFRYWVSGRKGARVMPLATVQYFDLQMGRRVLAELLGVPQRVNWRECVWSGDEEKKDAEAFREAFKEFDFNL